MANHKQAVGGHQRIETSNFLMIVLIFLTVIWGGLVEIVPLFFQRSTTQPVEGLKPYTALQLVGRDVYIREGCYNCHSQMVRPFRAETLRYGNISLAGEFVYDHPFQWGSKRTGPDLHRVGGRYSDEWHRIHLNNPRDVVPESNMPAYTWLNGAALDPASVGPKMAALRKVGVPYTDDEIAKAADEVKGKTEMDAVVAYLQGLGLAGGGERAAASADTLVDIVATGPALGTAYFESASADVQADAKAAVEIAVKALADNPGKRVLLSGFHDATGDAAQNAELAKQRAKAVREALVAAGVAKDAVLLRKPESTTGTGTDREARRVEIRLIDAQ